MEDYLFTMMDPLQWIRIASEEIWYILEILGGVAAAVTAVVYTVITYRRDNYLETRLNELERRVDAIPTDVEHQTDPEIRDRIKALEVMVEQLRNDARSG